MKDILSKSLAMVIIIAVVGGFLWVKNKTTPEFSDPVTLAEADARLAIFGQNNKATKDDLELHYLALPRVKQCGTKCDFGLPSEQPNIGQCHWERLGVEVPNERGRPAFLIISSLRCTITGEPEPMYQPEAEVCELGSDGSARVCVNRHETVYQRSGSSWESVPDAGHTAASLLKERALLLEKLALKK